MKKSVLFLKSISIECYMVCLYFVCMPFTIVTTPIGSLLKVITMPVVGILGFKLFIGKRKPLAFNSIHLVYSIYIVYTIAGLFLMPNQEGVIQTKDMILGYATLMLVTMRTYTEEEQELIESVWVIVGIICAYLALTSSEVANEYENRTMISVFGFYEDPNQFCSYFIMPMVVCVRRVVEKRKLTPFYILLIILMFYSVLRTGSRGGMIGISAGVAMSMLLAVRGIKARLIVILVAILCVALIVFVLFPMLPEDVQQRYTITSVIEDRGAGRFDIWMFLINYTFESPSRIIYGSGLLSTHEILQLSSDTSSSGAAHNQFIQVLADQGVTGLALFLLLISCCFFRNVKKQPYYSCAFVAIMAFSMSLTMYVFKPYINIIMMCSMTFINIGKVRGEKDEISTKIMAEN